MRTLFLAIIVTAFQFSFAQEAVEIPFKAIDKDYIELVETLRDINKSDGKNSIDIKDSEFKKFNDQDTRHLAFWKLAFHFAAFEEFDKCFEVLKKGQSEGMIFALDLRRSWPSYLKEIEKLEGYQSFIDQNKKLKEESKIAKNTEFMIQLPSSYDKNKSYPLLLLMHGGVGSIPDMQYAYRSQKLETEFIVAYFQGSNVEGSSIRTFARRGWEEKIVNGYKQIISKYAVDTTKVIVGGQSAGAYRSISLGFEDKISAKGFLLNFPVIPRDLTNQKYLDFKERDLKIVQLCGENDWAIQQQKEFGYWLDRYMIKNRFVVFPETGHGFPENYEHHLKTSIEYIFDEN
jgi:hypothetical protein